MTIRGWSRKQLDGLGPHDLSDDALGVVEIDLADGRTFDAEVLENGLRIRDGQTGRLIRYYRP